MFLPLKVVTPTKNIMYQCSSPDEMLSSHEVQIQKKWSNLSYVT